MMGRLQGFLFVCLPCLNIFPANKLLLNVLNYTYKKVHCDNLFFIIILFHLYFVQFQRANIMFLPPIFPKNNPIWWVRLREGSNWPKITHPVSMPK